MLGAIAKNLGAGSGIDTAALIADLAAASRAPKVARFETLTKSNQAKVSALAQARSDLDSFADSLGSLSAGKSLRSQPSSSDETALVVSANSGTLAATFTGQITVNSLARSQTAYSDYIASASSPVGQGGMTLSVNGATYAVAIDSSNDSLDGLAAAINATGSGVQAHVVEDAGGFRLVLKGESGAAHAYTLSADAGSAPELAQFTTATMTTGQVASDAAFVIDGVGYTRAANSVDDVIPGMTLDLKKADPSGSVTISVRRPVEALRQTLGDFVSVFNTLKNEMQAARLANNGSAAIRGLERQLGSLVSQKLTSHRSIAALADIGVSTTKDGLLALDTSRLDIALRNHPDAVEALFNPPRDAGRNPITDPGIAAVLDTLRDAAVTGSGALEQVRTSLQREADSIAKNRNRMEARENAYRARLERQYAGMDSRIGTLKATQTYLEQQISLWNGGNR